MSSDIRQPAAVRRNGPLATLDHRAFAAVLQLWRVWRQHRELRRLAEFDDRMLRDIGVSRGDVERALASPFRRDLDPERRARRNRTPS